MSMTWVDEVKKQFGDSILKVRESAPNEFEFTITQEITIEFLTYLKELKGGAFEHLADMTAYDAYPETPRFHVVYGLISMFRKLRATVVVPVVHQDESADFSGGNPSHISVTELWAGANWLEREVYDMYGIRFQNHPDQRRILMPDVFKGYPLRKDFIADYRQEFAKPGKKQSLFDPTKRNFVPDQLLSDPHEEEK